MKQVVYLDVYFFVNLIMDYLVLLFTRRLTDIHKRRNRCFLGALFGSLISTLLYGLLEKNGLIYLIFEYIITVILMNEVAFSPRTFIGNIKCFFYVYFVSVVMGGMVYFLYYHSGFSNIVKHTFVVVLEGKYSIYKLIGSWLIIYALLSITMGIFIKYRRPPNLQKYRIVLFVMEKSIDLWGIYDTGNSLTEQISGEIVHIAGERVLSIVDDKYDLQRKFRFVSYSSVGNANGVMESIIYDKMEIYNENGERIWECNKPRVAISKDDFLKKGYEKILNKEVFASN